MKIIMCYHTMLMLWFILYLRVISKYEPPGPYIHRSDLTKGFFWGLMHLPVPAAVAPPPPHINPWEFPFFIYG